MRNRTKLATGAAGVAVITGALFFGSTAFAATPAPAVIKACATVNVGTLHQVSAKTVKCPKGQYLVTWNQIGVAGKNGLNGAPGKNGINGKDGAAGKNGIDGAPGKNGVDGTPGGDGKDGTDGTSVNVVSAEGAPDLTSAETKPHKGDLYLDTTPGATTLYVFDGKAYGTGQLLQGKDGKDGTSVNVTTKALAPTAEEIAAAKDGDVWINTATDVVSVFDGTAFQSINGATGKDGKDGKSVSVAREEGNPVLAGSSITLSCGYGQTAIGAGFAHLPAGIHLVASDIGIDDVRDWVLTFDGPPTSAATVHVLCAVPAP